MSRGATDFAISKKGDLIAAAEGKNLSVWRLNEQSYWQLQQRVKSPSTIPAEHMKVFSAVAFSPDGKHIATGGRDGWVRLWSITEE